MTGEQSGPIMRWILELVLADLERRGGVPTYSEAENSTAEPEAD